jgi:hypothetical protein
MRLFIIFDCLSRENVKKVFEYEFKNFDMASSHNIQQIEISSKNLSTYPTNLQNIYILEDINRLRYFFLIKFYEVLEHFPAKIFTNILYKYFYVLNLFTFITSSSQGRDHFVFLSFYIFALFFFCGSH